MKISDILACGRPAFPSEVRPPKKPADATGRGDDTAAAPGNVLACPTA